jgi:hypothetical protein
MAAKKTILVVGASRGLGSDSIPLVVKMVERNAGVPGVRFTNRHGEILPW